MLFRSNNTPRANRVDNATSKGVACCPAGQRYSKFARRNGVAAVRIEMAKKKNAAVTIVSKMVSVRARRGRGEKLKTYQCHEGYGAHHIFKWLSFVH